MKLGLPDWAGHNSTVSVELSPAAHVTIPSVKTVYEQLTVSSTVAHSKAF